MVRPICPAMASEQLPKNDVDLVCGQGFSNRSQSSPRSQNKAIYSTEADLISLSVQGALTDVSSDCNSTSIPNDRDFHYLELQASLETLLDGFPGVEPLGLPSGRFFFMILPGKMRNSS